MYTDIIRPYDYLAYENGIVTNNFGTVLSKMSEMAGLNKSKVDLKDFELVRDETFNFEDTMQERYIIKISEKVETDERKKFVETGPYSIYVMP